ncbi:neuropeptide SIFamide-like [Pectinophora gossypiella]|uniref:neuropeptide SIFamide-like n=1 Tax=Pectinophora gossypiella TaxID=13191 RepID=UPI00214E4624|nr:neuropeptide SIFamide-like [Pectinophora gossypiella]
MRVTLAFCVLAVVFCVIIEGEANYRKPPFNGSIFGKRGNVVEYDSTGRALNALCDIAMETCQAWFQTIESK